MTEPLHPAELAAAADRLTQRTNQLRARGWGRPAAPYDRSALYDFTLDRALLKAAGHPKYKENRA